MTKKNAKNVLRFILILVTCILIGRFIGMSLAQYQNKKDTQEYINSGRYIKVYKACMYQSEEEGEKPEVNCISFIDRTTLGYSI